MDMKEAMLEIKKNPKKGFTHERWWSSQFIYYKKGKYYQEDGVVFDKELQGREILTCQHTPNKYSVFKLKKGQAIG